MKTMRTTKKLALILVSGIVLAATAALMSGSVKACPPDTLSSPPSTMSVYAGGCSATIPCDRSATTTFTLSNAGTCTHTWTFTNTTTSCQKVFNTAAGVATLQVSIPGSTGDAITLVITDPGGGSSPTYNITGSQCI